MLLLWLTTLCSWEPNPPPPLSFTVHPVPAPCLSAGPGGLVGPLAPLLATARANDKAILRMHDDEAMTRYLNRTRKETLSRYHTSRDNKHNAGGDKNKPNNSVGLGAFLGCCRVTIICITSQLNQKRAVLFV